MESDRRRTLANKEEGNHQNKTTGPQMVVFEDNEAVIKIVLKRRSMALRHVLRTYRIAMDWCFEVCAQPDVHLKYINTRLQVADLMTKEIGRAHV